MGNQSEGEPLISQPQFFALSARTIDGRIFDFKSMKGKAKAFLIINTASKAKKTNEVFGSLCSLYERFEQKGLQILIFPSNIQHNELATDAQILNFLRANFKTNFIVFQKTEVNGPKPHPVFAFLRKNGPLYNPDSNCCLDLPGDFTKFLLNQEGRVVCMLDKSKKVQLLREWLQRTLE